MALTKDENKAKPESKADQPQSPERRDFFRTAGRGGTALALGALVGVASGPYIARGAKMNKIPGKEKLILHNDRPLNMEAHAHLLNDDITPTSLHFVRNNGLVPDVDMNKFRLTVDGEVNKALSFSLDELKQKFEVFTQAALIECGGNGRANFNPKVRGNQWNRGAIACGLWTGVRLKDVLGAAGLKRNAVYTGHYGLDPSLNPGKVPQFSRGIPIAKALDEHTMLAFQLNGEDIPKSHGYPLRVVVPGWIGSASQKWLTRIWIRDQVHDTKKMTGKAYRVPKYPIAPGFKVPKGDFMIATEWQIKSLITSPAAKTPLKVKKGALVRGHAWAGEEEVKKVELSFDYGRHWVKAKLGGKRDKYAWHTWEYNWTPTQTGYHEITVRAWDGKGNTQPYDQPWNPKGYLGNVYHRVGVQVTG